MPTGPTPGQNAQHKFEAFVVFAALTFLYHASTGVTSFPSAADASCPCTATTARRHPSAFRRLTAAASGSAT